MDELAPRDGNRVTGLLVGDYTHPEGRGTVRLVADPVTRRLLVSAIGTVTVTPEEVSTATNSNVTVGTGSTTILAANANRISATIVNDSDQVIYLALGATATMNSGVRINANGGSAEITQYTGQITGICLSGSKRVTVTEL